MSGEKRPPEAELEEINVELAAGLRTCRSVISNYKSLLASDSVDAPKADPAPPPEEGEK